MKGQFKPLVTIFFRFWKRGYKITIEQEQIVCTHPDNKDFKVCSLIQGDDLEAFIAAGEQLIVALDEILEKGRNDHLLEAKQQISAFEETYGV